MSIRSDSHGIVMVREAGIERTAAGIHLAVKDPGFERLHPRGDGGRFSRKLFSNQVSVMVSGDMKPFGLAPEDIEAMFDSESLERLGVGLGVEVTSPPRFPGMLAIRAKGPGVEWNIHLRGDEATLDFADFAPEMRGAGIARDLFAAQVRAFDRIGLARMRLLASKDVGGYAWARFGFDWDPDGSTDTKQFARMLEMKHRLRDGYEPAHTWEYAAIARDDMLGSSWDGVLDLDKSTDSRKVFDAYVDWSSRFTAPQPGDDQVKSFSVSMTPNATHLVRPEVIQSVIENRTKRGKGTLRNRWNKPVQVNGVLQKGSRDALAERAAKHYQARTLRTERERLSLVEAYNEETRRTAAGIVERSDVAMRMRETTLEALLDTGTMPPNQDWDREEGYVANMVSWENALFGHTVHYGYLTNRYEDLPEHQARTFSDIKVVLNDDVRARATFTYGDTLYYNLKGDPADWSMTPVPFSKARELGHLAVSPSVNVIGFQNPGPVVNDRQPEWPTISPAMQKDLDAYMAFKKSQFGSAGWDEQAPYAKQGWYEEHFENWTGDSWGNLWEAQIHGGLAPADIKTVVFQQAPSKALQARLDDQGIPWQVWSREDAERGLMASEDQPKAKKKDDGSSSGDWDPALHPRDPIGRFAVKGSGTTEQSTEGKQVSAAARQFAARISRMVGAYGLRVPSGVRFDVVSAEEMSRMGEGNWSAYSQGNRIVVTEDAMALMEKGERQLKRRGAPDPDVMAVMYEITHEVLHQVNDKTDQVTNDEWNDGRSTDEAFVDAVATDIMQGQIKDIERRTGAGYGGVIYPRYKDEVVDLRKLSAKATGTKWTSKQAAAWRKRGLMGTYQQRRQMMASARGAQLADDTPVEAGLFLSEAQTRVRSYLRNGRLVRSHVRMFEKGDLPVSTFLPPSSGVVGGTGDPVRVAMIRQKAEAIRATRQEPYRPEVVKPELIFEKDIQDAVDAYVAQRREALGPNWKPSPKVLKIYARDEARTWWLQNRSNATASTDWSEVIVERDTKTKRFVLRIWSKPERKVVATDVSMEKWAEEHYDEVNALGQEILAELKQRMDGAQALTRSVEPSGPAKERWLLARKTYDDLYDKYERVKRDWREQMAASGRQWFTDHGFDGMDYDIMSQRNNIGHQLWQIEWQAKDTGFARDGEVVVPDLPALNDLPPRPGYTVTVNSDDLLERSRVTFEKNEDLNVLMKDYESRLKKASREWKKAEEAMSVEGKLTRSDHGAITAQLLSEIRPIGGVQPLRTKARAGSARDSTKQMLDRAVSMFPADWVARGAASPPDITGRTNNRANYQGTKQELRIGPGDSLRTVVHEYGHYMEDMVPGLKEMEQLWLSKRAEGTHLVTFRPGSSETYWLDAAPYYYTVKQKYPGGYTEVFTTGADALMAEEHREVRLNLVSPEARELALSRMSEGSSGWVQAAREAEFKGYKVENLKIWEYDPDHAAFTLGLLASL